MSAATFHWDDPLLLDQQLTEEERMVRDAAQAYAQDKLAPRVTEAFRHERTDAEIFREMGEVGLLGPTIPEEYGGPGLNYVSYGLIAREVERVDSGYRSMMSVQSSLVMVPIYEFGSDAQKQKYLPKLATGEWIGCFGLTEPNHGSDPGSMVTRAKRCPAATRCPARRCGSPTRRSPTCSSRAKLEENGKDAIRGFILEKGWKGLSAPAIHGKVGLRASITGEIVLDEVFVPEENLMPNVRPARPVHVPELGALRDRMGALGAAESCWHTARQYVLDRQQFGWPLAANQLIQKKLADMQTEITSACKACCASAG